MVAFVTLLNGQEKVFESPPMSVTDGLDVRSRAIPIQFDLPIQHLKPGRYECQVTVLDPSGQKAAFWRGTIAVVP
jgi:hypothetical protein